MGSTSDIRFRDPESQNAGGHNPRVTRVDLILGEVRRNAGDPDSDTNVTARVIERFGEDEWRRVGETVTVTTTLPRIDGSIYIRVRGTNTRDSEPVMDLPGENPWDDLWFYANPIFIDVERDVGATACGWVRPCLAQNVLETYPYSAIDDSTVEGCPGIDGPAAIGGSFRA